MKQIDLRSDTVTRPSQKMLEAMIRPRWGMMCMGKTHCEPAGADGRGLTGMADGLSARQVPRPT